MKGLLTVLAGLLAILVLHNLQDYLSARSSTETIAQDHESIDYYLTDFSLQAVTADGHISHEIKGEYLGHWRERRSSLVIKPYIASKQRAVQGDLSDAAILQANEALLDHATEQAELTGDVRIAANSEQVQQAFELTTTALRYRFVDRHLSSAETVTITAPAFTLQGTGLDSQLDEAYLRLNANVKSTYHAQTERP